MYLIVEIKNNELVFSNVFNSLFLTYISITKANSLYIRTHKTILPQNG